MRRSLFAVAVLTAGAVAQLDAQSVRSRSGDYLFAATASDVRGLWVNPAGTAVVPGASVMAEFALDFPRDSSIRFAQWTLAFTSRGLSVGYQRDRFGEDPNTGALRFGLAVPFKGGGIGAAFTFYQGSPVGDVSHRGFDLGVRYRLLGALDLALVARNIGRPTARLVRQPATGVLGANLQIIPRHAGVQLEVIAAERLDTSGYDMAYRSGLMFSTGGKLPIAFVGALDVDSDFGLQAWAIGLTIGGQDSGTALASGPAGSGTTRLQRMSLTGVATRSF